MFWVESKPEQAFLEVGPHLSLLGGGAVAGGLDGADEVGLGVPGADVLGGDLHRGQGLAGGADMILIPEQKYRVDGLVETIRKRHERGKDFSIVVVAEGVQLISEEGKDDEYVVSEGGRDEFGHVKLGGSGQLVADTVEYATGFETRVTVLGHLQRGGTPTAFDRVLGTRFGIAAVDLVHEENYGQMVSLQGNEIVPIALADAVDQLKVVDQEFYDLAKVFFG